MSKNNGGEIMGEVCLKVIDFGNTSKEKVIGISKLKKTQQRMKKIVPDNSLAYGMLNHVAKAIATNMPVLSSLCDEIEKMLLDMDKKKDFNDYIEVSKCMNALNDFIICTRQEPDYKKAYVFFENNKLNLWMIIENLDYSSTIKYTRLARTLMDAENSNIKVMLYDYTEEDEVLEELKDLRSGYCDL